MNWTERMVAGLSRVMRRARAANGGVTPPALTLRVRRAGWYLIQREMRNEPPLLPVQPPPSGGPHQT